MCIYKFNVYSDNIREGQLTVLNCMRNNVYVNTSHNTLVVRTTMMLMIIKMMVTMIMTMTMRFVRADTGDLPRTTAIDDV